MVQLVIHTEQSDPAAPGFRYGGVPLAPAGFAWPVCRTCRGPMQFLVQVPYDAGYALAFMCQNEPGLCEEWDPEYGGNAAYLVRGDLAPATPPADGVTALEFLCTAALDEPVGGPYDEARTGWGKRTGRGMRAVLGQFGGEPDWMQGEEPQTCPDCRRPMALVAQLESGPDGRTEANYGGGGTAYLFACAADDRAAFLWQC